MAEESHQWWRIFYEDKQLKEWFIAMLLPHMHRPMGQQKIDSEEEALDISMKLEFAPRDDAQFGALQI